jgi:hypothetical protein
MKDSWFAALRTLWKWICFKVTLLLATVFSIGFYSISFVLFVKGMALIVEPLKVLACGFMICAFMCTLALYLMLKPTTAEYF